MYSMGSLINMAFTPEVFDGECKALENDIKKYMLIKNLKKNFKKSEHAR